eukprot:TRINITY_DN45966_c0_g1_i1.p1 TRINITY_DN45966_c0_g1~~TRINITY_DN45966_c0_g1_i1.p1  ORF type:complete len:233 (+),score=21.23 TRINITY_DN45966_c0_g1_i1:612-1310(+)
MFGLNMIRLHQKVNPERWYYHADRLGVVVFQDMVQKYGDASNATVPLFVQDFKAMVIGRKSHPCIVQFTTFNEGDLPAVSLIEGCELNNTRMGLPPNHHGLEVLNEQWDCGIGGIAVLLDHILEDNHTQSVRMVVPTLRVDFLVQPDHVQSEHWDSLDVVRQGIVCGCRVLPIRPPRLIEEASQKSEIPVEEWPLALWTRSEHKCPEPKVRGDVVGPRFNQNIVQERRLWAP